MYEEDIMMVTDPKLVKLQNSAKSAKKKTQGLKNKIIDLKK